MRKRLLRWEIAGFLLVGLLGTLLHFLYDWSGGGLITAVISGVNESTWEHMKLLFVPMFIFSVIQIGGQGKDYPNFLAVRAVSTLVGLALIPVLFYTYAGILGYYISWVNIAIFYLSALTAFCLDFQLLRKGMFSAPWQQILGLLVLWALAFCFVWCTFRPPQLALWRDPITGQYGI